MGLAIGASADDVALQKLTVYPVPMLKGKGLLRDQAFNGHMILKKYTYKERLGGLPFG